VLHRLLADAAETGLLGQYRNETVHLAVDFDRLDDLAAVGFQAAVEVVKPDSRHGAGRPVEKLAGPAFADRIVALLLPARNQIVSLFEDHPAQFGNLVGRILQVGVHRDDDLPFRSRKTAVQGRGFAVVTGEPDAPHRRILLFEGFDDAPRIVGRTVVHQDNFVGIAVLRRHAVDPCDQFGQRFRLVVERHYNRYVEFIHLLLYSSYSPACVSNGRGARESTPAMIRPKTAPKSRLTQIPPQTVASTEGAGAV